MTVTMWTDRQAEEYHALMLRFRPTKLDRQIREAAARALVVRHPAVQMAGLDKLTIYEMTTPDHQGRQIHRATIQLREFIPETKRTAGVSKVKDAKQGPLPYTKPISANTTSPSVSQGSVGDLMAANPDTHEDEDEGFEP